jgi:phage terminase large subunit-like protein
LTFVEQSAEYRRAILSGEIPSCSWVRLACQRDEDDLAKQADSGFPFVFNADKANRACRFISLLQHIQGNLAGTRLKLEPWQCFIICAIFGWTWRDTGTRRYRRAYVEVGKGNGKSLLAAGIALYMAFAEGEGGADCVCTATSMEQARIVLDTARQMCLKDVKLCHRFGLNVIAHQIQQKKTISRLRGMPAKGSSIEGVSLHAGIIDEIHAAARRDVFDNLRTACSKRTQSLLFIITTAGGTIDGIGYETHCYAESLLNKEKDDPEFFTIVYTVDENDDWTQEESWKKANPCYGVSVDPRGIAAECNRALQLASLEPAFRAKHLCQWVSSGTDEPFVSFEKVRSAYDKDLRDEFEGQWCVVGADLATRLDMCAVTRVHGKMIDGKAHYYVFTKCFLPSATLAASTNASYQGWLREGWLTETAGSVTDLEFIEEHIFETFQKYKVRELSYDPLQSQYLISRLAKRMPDRADALLEFGQYAKLMTGGMVELENALATGRLHTNNPILLWALSNLRAKRTGMNLVYPVRPRDRAQKIDPAVALVMCLRSCSVLPLEDSDSTESPYNTRGITLL